MIGGRLYLSAVKAFFFSYDAGLPIFPRAWPRHGEAGLDGFAEIHVFKVVLNLVLIGDKRIKHEERFFVPTQPESDPVDDMGLVAHE